MENDIKVFKNIKRFDNNPRRSERLRHNEIKEDLSKKKLGDEKDIISNKDDEDDEDNKSKISKQFENNFNDKNINNYYKNENDDFNNNNINEKNNNNY